MYGKSRISPGDWRVRGPPARLTSGTGLEVHPRVTGGGRIIFTNLSLNADVWGLPVAANEGNTAGELRRITQDSGADRSPHISSDGKKVVFHSDRAGAREIWIKNLDSSSGKQVRILYESGRRFHETRFSPDARWVVTGAIYPRQILLAPFRGEQEIPLSEWISVAEEVQQKRHPVWSPDGNLIYFLSDRDGFRCIYGQRLEPQTKRPRGTPIAVRHFHQTSQSLLQTDPSSIALSLGGGLLVFGMNEAKGNIWISEPAPGSRQ